MKKIIILGLAVVGMVIASRADWLVPAQPAVATPAVSVEQFAVVTGRVETVAATITGLVSQVSSVSTQVSDVVSQVAGMGTQMTASASVITGLVGQVSGIQTHSA